MNRRDIYNLESGLWASHTFYKQLVDELERQDEPELREGAEGICIALGLFIETCARVGNLRTHATVHRAYQSDKV
jgi:hypothetical protein